MDVLRRYYRLHDQDSYNTTNLTDACVLIRMLAWWFKNARMRYLAQRRHCWMQKQIVTIRVVRGEAWSNAIERGKHLVAYMYKLIKSTALAAQSRDNDDIIQHWQKAALNQYRQSHMWGFLYDVYRCIHGYIQWVLACKKSCHSALMQWFMNWKHVRQHTLAVADDFFLSYTSQRSGMHSRMLQVGEQQSKMFSLHRVYAYSLLTDVTKPLCLRRGVSYTETSTEKQPERMCSPPQLGAVYPPVCYKVKSAGGKFRPRLVYKVTRPPSRAEAALPPAVSELARGASVHHGPERLPVSLALSRPQLASQYILHNILSEPNTKIRHK